MSIQGAINQILGTAAGVAGASRVVNKLDPEKQRELARQEEKEEIKAQVKNQNQRELALKQASGAKSELDLEKADTEYGQLYRELQGDYIELTRKAFYNEPTKESAQMYSHAISEYNRAIKAYDMKRQKQANQNATQQAQAKAEQKQAILTNINKWGETNKPQESKLITDVNKWGTK